MTAREEKVTGGEIVHLTGTPWYQLPLPGRRHQCVPATIASLNYGGVLISRCACGAVRWKWLGWDDYGPWEEKNSRRRGTAHSFTVQ